MPAMTHTSRSTREMSRLVEEHLPLVNHVVFQVAVHFPRHVDRDELINAGALGLVEAGRRYDPDRGVPFGPYAARRIRGAIIDAVRAADWAPRSVRVLARRLDEAEHRLAAELGRRPNVDEAAAELGVSADELAELRERVFRSVVLAMEHVVADEDEELTLIDVLADGGREPAAELEDRELKAYLRQAVANLSERHRIVVVGYFIEDRSSEEIARFLGVTESRVSQMRTEALATMRRGIEAQYDPAASAAPTGLVERRRAAYAARIRATSDTSARITLPADPETDAGFRDEVGRLVQAAAN